MATLLCFFLALLLPGPAHAHDRARADVTITVRMDAQKGANVDFDYEADPEPSEEAARLPDYSVRPETAQTYAPILSRELLQGDGLFTQSGQRCEWGGTRGIVAGKRLTLHTPAYCIGPVISLTWRPTAVDRLKSGFLYLGKLDWEGRVSPFSADKGSKETTLAPFVASFGNFVKLGMQHIGAALAEWRTPGGQWHLPDGIDHILFVLALVLGGGGLWGIFTSITGFTVGHSVTLALAAFNIASPPARLIESLIALSIAVVAAEDLIERGKRHRWIVATAFGLVHGFGFAGALRELTLARSELLSSLLGFNLGVELGQACFVAAFFPVVVALEKRGGRPGKIALRAAAAGVLLAGAWWFVQRAFGLGSP